MVGIIWGGWCGDVVLLGWVVVVVVVVVLWWWMFCHGCRKDFRALCLGLFGHFVVSNVVFLYKSAAGLSSCLFDSVCLFR